jgi:CO/xanthine dehydrogenase FAD-binding subunit
VEKHKGDALKLCGGNQLVVFKWLDHSRFTRLIDTRHVPELTQVSFNDAGLKFGSATTISSLRKLLDSAVGADSAGVRARATSDATPLDSTWMRLYLPNPAVQTAGWAELSQHLSKVASTNLRNSATVLGNLMACQTKAFPSDIATPLFALGATVTLYPDGEPSLSLQEFLTRAPDPQVIVTSITIPFSAPESHFQVFKVMKRPQNCISNINAAFKCAVNAQVFIVIIVLQPRQHAAWHHNMYVHEWITRTILFSCLVVFGCMFTVTFTCYSYSTRFAQSSACTVGAPVHSLRYVENTRTLKTLVRALSPRTSSLKALCGPRQKEACILGSRRGGGRRGG